MSQLLSVRILTQTRSRRWLIAAFILSAISLFALRLWVQTSRVPYGCYLADVGLGASRWDEVKSKITAYAARAEQRAIPWSLGARTCALVPRAAGIAIDSVATYRSLVERTKRRSLVSKLLGEPFEVTLEVSIDEGALATWIEQCEATAIEDRPVLGRLLANEGSRDAQMSVIPPKSGRRVDRSQLKRLIPRALVQLNDASLALPVISVPAFPSEAALERARQRATELLSHPVVLLSESAGKRITMLRSDLAKIIEWKPDASGELLPELKGDAFDAWLAARRHRIEQRAQNATYRLEGRNRLVLVKEEPGQRIIMKRLREDFTRALLAGERSVRIPFEATEQPQLTAEQVAALQIDELVGEFSTRYACCQARVANIHRIADLVNGAIVLPGAIFDVNQFVGPRTLENGFVAAKSIQDGELTDTIGGGVCQFATTLYNAVMRAGFEILERQPHSYWFEKYPMGHEATLSWPKPNLVFRNDSPFGLLILVTYDTTRITVKLYGHKDGRRVTWGVSGRSELVMPKTEFLPNHELEPDEEKTKEGGSMGWTVTTTRRVTLADFTVREDKRKVVYKPKLRRVEVHPCKIPLGEPGASGEKCPEPSEPPASDESAAAAAPSD